MSDSGSYTTLTSVETLDRHLDGYRVTRQIGHGAMGVVFEAEQKSLGRRVAIKVLPSSMALRKRTVKRFLREAEAMGRLSHENIVAVHDVGSISDLHYFCMKYVEGPPLDRVLEAGPLAIGDVVQIGIDVAGALSHAHSRGVMHRDIKPGNLLRDGERVVLTDFGLARPLDSEETGTMTESGDLVGTPLYMSPEQISGERVDGRADLWGLGVTLYELLTQRPPFPGPNAQGILNSILHKDPPLLHKIRDDVPRDLEAVILKCLEKDTARRYSGAAALLEDLIAVREGRGVSASPPRFFDPAVRWTRRHPVEASVVGVAILVTCVLGIAVQQVRRQMSTTQDNLETAQEGRRQAEDLRDSALAARNEIRVRDELFQARIQWAEGKADGDEGRCMEAEARLLGLLESMTRDEQSIDEHLDQIAEAFTALAGWVHQESSDDERAMELVERYATWDDPEQVDVVRAATLMGLERYDQALLVHRQRARRNREDARPLVDAAGMMRQRGLSARRNGRLPAFFDQLNRSLATNDAAIQLAERAMDGEMLVTIHIEQARALIDLDRYEEALERLDAALEQDESRVEAGLLQLSALRKQKELEQQNKARLAAVASSDTRRGTSAINLGDLSDLIPSAPTLDARDLESAGRGLQSIYRGLQGLLRPPDEADEEAAPEQRTGPVEES